VKKNLLPRKKSPVIKFLLPTFFVNFVLLGKKLKNRGDDDEDNESELTADESTSNKPEDDYRIGLSERIEHHQKQIFKIVNTTRKKPQPQTQKNAPKMDVKKAVDLFNGFVREAKVIEDF